MQTSKHFLVSAIVLALGLGVSGYFIGHGIERFKAQGLRTIKVKGIGERIVDADFAVWNIEFKTGGKTADESQNAFLKNQKLVMKFLKDRGFQDEEIQKKISKTYIMVPGDPSGQRVSSSADYGTSGKVTLRTRKIQELHKAFKEINALISEKVLLGPEHVYANNDPVRYFIKDFDSLRPQILQEATQSAQKMADQFARDSGSRVGRLIHADQGSFSIINEDGDEWGGDQTPRKKIRVITQMTYEIQ